MTVHQLDNAKRQVSRVQAAMHYLAPMPELPVYYPQPYPTPPGIPRHNGQVDTHIVAIENVRPIAYSFGIHRNGFQLIKHASAVKNFYDDEEIRRVYDVEAGQLVKQVTGADRVHVFNHTWRRASDDGETSGSASDGGVNNPAMRKGGKPFSKVHGDFTKTSGPSRLRELLGAEAETLLRRRWIALNVWRPLRGPVRELPLAVCDGRSVEPDDLVPCTLIYPDRRSEIFDVRFNPSHRWYYAPDMTENEAWMFKTYDSDCTTPVRFTPHSAFEDPTTGENAPPRESLELRAFAFFKD